MINAAQVRRYLEGPEGKASDVKAEKSITIQGSHCDKAGDQLSVVWCEGLNHGEVFDLPVWRSKLRARVLSEARRCR